MAKAKTTRSKAKSAAGAKRSPAKKPSAKAGGGKKPAGKKSGAKAGDKLSPRSLAKASVKPAKAPAPKPKAAAKPAKADDKVLKSILHSLNEMKAEETVVIDLSDKSSIGETMVVTTGRSNVHLQSIADRVIKDLKAEGLKGIAVEGLRQGDWVVIDTGTVLVHVFRPEVRAFYGIENMWSA